MEVILHHNPFTELIFGVLLVTGLGYALIYRSNSTHFLSVLRCVNDRNLADQLFRENNRMVQQTLLWMNICSITLLGVFVSWGVFRLGGLKEFSVGAPLFGVLAVSLFVVFRFTVLNGIALISKKQPIADQVLHQFWITLAFLGPVLLLITSLSVFGPFIAQLVFIWVGVGFLGFGYLIFMIRSLLLATQEKGIGRLNLIYYLCALEIMPVLVAYRTFLS